MADVLTEWLVVLASVALAVVVVASTHWVTVRLSRRSGLFHSIARRAHHPTQLLAIMFAVWVSLPDGVDGVVSRLLSVGFVAAAAWEVATLLLVLEDAALGRFRLDVENNLAARRVHTQVRVIRRVTVALVTVLAIGAMLMTFPQARAAGASILASAGLIGVVAALAAQSTLGNVFAGLHLAFGNALRLDDVVVVEGEWGKIEEITLGYVVVRIWDQRRLILPNSYFTEKPFQNWTRSESSILGTVELDVDWSVPVEKMRSYLTEVVEESPLWDRRVVVLQVTEATGGLVRVRALVSAADSSTMWDLRCLVREKLVEWVQHIAPDSRPRNRAELTAFGDSRIPAQGGVNHG